MRYLLPVVALAALAASLAQAQVANIDERLVPITTAPLLVTNICAGWQPPEWAPEAHRKEQLGFDVMPLYLQVQNTSQKPIVAYRFMVAAYDVFGDYVDTIRATSLAAVAPGASDYGRWSLRLRLGYMTQTIVVYLEAVRFQDGSIWRIDPESIAALVPSTAPGMRFHSWHIMPDTREVLGQQYKDAG